MLGDAAIGRKPEDDRAGEGGDLAVLVEDDGPVLDTGAVTSSGRLAEP